jgi:hypothetical protein
MVDIVALSQAMLSYMGLVFRLTQILLHRPPDTLRTAVALAPLPGQVTAAARSSGMGAFDISHSYISRNRAVRFSTIVLICDEVEFTKVLFTKNAFNQG